MRINGTYYNGLFFILLHYTLIITTFIIITVRDGVFFSLPLDTCSFFFSSSLIT